MRYFSEWGKNITLHTKMYSRIGTAWDVTVPPAETIPDESQSQAPDAPPAARCVEDARGSVWVQIANWLQKHGSIQWVVVFLIWLVLCEMNCKLTRMLDAMRLCRRWR